MVKFIDMHAKVNYDCKIHLKFMHNAPEIKEFNIISLTFSLN